MNLDKKISLSVPIMVIVFVAIAGIAGTVGYYGSDMMETPTGESTESASMTEMRSVVESVVGQQVQSQKQQLSLMAQQSENISSDDLSIDAEVGAPTQSNVSGLYYVPVVISGSIPSQQSPGELQDIEEEQGMYISEDGRYLFQEPTDLKELEQQAQQQPVQQPTTQPDSQ